MGGYVSLIVGIFLLTFLSLGMHYSIKAGNLQRNEVLGFRTRSTLASDEAWEVGHRKTLPYLQATTVCGAVGIATSISAPILLDNDSPSSLGVIYVFPILAFLIQIVTIILAALKANKESKVFNSKEGEFNK